MRSVRVVVAMLVAVTAVGLVEPAGATPACAGPAAGGDWPLYGHDLSNSRVQPDEHVIDAGRAGSLQKVFAIKTTATNPAGWFFSTPVVAGGCLYAATSDGTVIAANADTGDIVWTTRYEVGVSGIGGTISGAVTVSGDTAFVHVSEAGKPFVAALDRLTGVERWRTVVSHQPGTFIESSPVPFDGMVFTGVSGDEYVDGTRGEYAITDQADGRLLAHGFVIPDADYDKGYWGGGVWGTAAYDPDTRDLFVGSGNPSSYGKEHRFTNALLKIDGDPSRATFGTIVDAYKGNFDQYYPGLDQQPLCQMYPNIEYFDRSSTTCLELDIDFGASPSLWRAPSGELMLGDLQKSGVYHAVYTDLMQQAWTSLVGTPTDSANAASPAADGTSVYAAAGMPGQLVALAASNGTKRWLHPNLDAVHFEPVSVADGLVYETDIYGYLRIVDAATGLLVAIKDLYGDSGGVTGGGINVTSAGVALARNTVYAATSGVIVAYR